MQHCIILHCFFREVISKTRASGFQTPENNKTTRPAASWFQMCCRVWKPDETLALVFFSIYIGLYKTPNKTLSCLVLSWNSTLTPPGGGGVLDVFLGGEVRPGPSTLILFKTKIVDFPTLFKTEFRFLIPCLRHLTRSHTLCKTKINKKVCCCLVRRTYARAVYCPRKDTLFKPKIDKIDTLIKTKNDKIDTLFF